MREFPPHSGQSAPKRRVSVEKLNDKERQVLEVLRADANPQAIVQLGFLAFPNEPSEIANSWTRNALRRLIQGGWVEKVSRGTYCYGGDH